MANFFISPILGAIIGYFTNWLAIKMLFRPHNEWKIGKIRIPFTPGLIPKERHKLAKKIADTVGSHLLTQEVLMKELTATDTLSRIDTLASELLIKMQVTQITVKEALHFFLGENLTPRIEQAKATFTSIIFNYLTSSNTIDSVVCFITGKVRRFLQGPAVFQQARPVLDVLQTYILHKTNAFFQDAGHKEFFEDSISTFFNKYLSEGKLISAYLPEKATIGVKAWIQENMPHAVGWLRGFLEKNPAVDEKLEKLVGKTIDDNFGRLLGMFINHEKIYTNIKESLFEYLSDQDNLQYLTDKAWLAFDDFLNKDISFLAEKIDRQFISQRLSYIAEDWITDDFVNGIFTYLTQQTHKAESFGLYEAIIKAEPAFDQKLDAFIRGIITAQSDKAEPLVHDLTRYSFEKMLAIRIDKIIEIAGGEKNIRTAIMSYIGLLLEKGAVHIVGSMNIERMVEDKINQFEVAEAEDIIISVVNKELQAITIVGGVLGFVIGLIPQLLQLIGIG